MFKLRASKLRIYLKLPLGRIKCQKDMESQFQILLRRQSIYSSLPSLCSLRFTFWIFWLNQIGDIGIVLFVGRRKSGNNQLLGKMKSWYWECKTCRKTIIIRFLHWKELLLILNKGKLYLFWAKMVLESQLLSIS